MLLRRSEKLDQIANGVVAVLGVAKRKLVMYLVAIPPSVARLRHVARFLELADDLRDGPLSDADRRGHVSQPCGRLVRDDLEHVSVVRHETERMISFT
jgi:hypothetical protein